jgi:hypothetical protein
MAHAAAAAAKHDTQRKIEDACLCLLDAIERGFDPAVAIGLPPTMFSTSAATESHDGAYHLSSALKVMKVSYGLLNVGATVTQREVRCIARTQRRDKSRDLFFAHTTHPLPPPRRPPPLPCPVGVLLERRALGLAGRERRGDLPHGEAAPARPPKTHARVSERSRPPPPQLGVLNVPRHALGIFAASRGWFAGAVVDDDAASAPFVSAPPRPIDGAAVAERIPVSVHPSAAYILIVEKECIFRRLVEDGVANGCVLLTGCGFPDLATRAFTHQLASSAPSLPVYGLCDWNVFGLAILRSYARGGSSAHPEANAWGVPVRWLGLRSGDVEAHAIPPSSLQATSSVDDTRAVAMLREASVRGNAGLAGEVGAWVEGREKAEVEALLTRGIRYLSTHYLPAKLGEGEEGSLLLDA